MLRRICLYGGPGCGKSVNAALTFAQLKIEQLEIELVREYIKDWVYEGRAPESFDQCYIFNKQMHAEDLVLRPGHSAVDYIVTDCPIFLCTCYAKKNQTPGWKPLIALAEEFDERFPPLHIYIKRGDKPYRNKGRYQDLEAAIEMDNFVYKELQETNKNFHELENVDPATVMKLLGR